MWRLKRNITRVFLTPGILILRRGDRTHVQVKIKTQALMGNEVVGQGYRSSRRVQRQAP